jgi:hypothetical protein
MEAVRSTVLMHCVHKAGGWQPKAAGGWFALLTFNITIVLVNRSFLHLIAPENPFISTLIRPITDFTN